MAHGDMSFFSRPSSSAVKITAPTSDEPDSPKPSKKDSTQRQCRNILIYGSCKFQDKGCIYYHPPRDEPLSAPDSPTPAAALPAQAVNAPVFIPKGHPGSPSLSEAVPASIQQKTSVSSYVFRVLGPDSSSPSSRAVPRALNALVPY
ncbi:hypothetical protein BD309DRAFT_919527 [Dichomitus squalens]|nr:hypothetical protein BD309DRAFT_919527 [Dichomitus squalens]